MRSSWSPESWKNGGAVYAKDQRLSRAWRVRPGSSQSAAAVMIAVFTSFTVGGFLVVQMLGFTLAVAVLIDATVVRMVVGPALLKLAGDWNWWPFGLYGARATSEKKLIP